MSAGKTLPGLIACSCLLLLFALLPALPSSAAELGPASDLRVTIYSQDVSFVRETRSLSLQAGESLIVASDVSERLRPDTASLLLPADVPLQLLEHNFDYDLVEPGKLLRRFLGSPIVVNSSGASMTVTLLSLNGDSLLVESPEGISAAPLADIALPAGSDSGLFLQPTLSWQCHATQSVSTEAELQYLTSGLSWNADYELQFDEELQSATLLGWTTIRNTSDTDYRNAEMMLMAGDINLVPQEQPGYRSADIFLDQAYFKYSPDWFGYYSEQLFEYYLYNLRQRTDILARQQKQISFLSPSTVDIRSRYVGRLEWLYNEFFQVFEIDNTEENGLGIPLPAGNVRFVGTTQSGTRLPAGDGKTKHTPKNDTIRIERFLGDSLLWLSDFNDRESLFKSGYGLRAVREIDVLVHSRLDRETTVYLSHRPGLEWEVVECDVQWERLDANTCEFAVQIPAGGTVPLHVVYGKSRRSK